MESCNGRMHSEMTDAYDSYSYPCPGPDKCANAASMLRKGEGPFKDNEKIALREELETTKRKLQEANEELAWRRPK